MATKSQHGLKYRPLPPFLRELREKGGLTQRQLGKKLNKPQSYIYNCETANRRVDIAEFIEWAKACGVSPGIAFRRYLSTTS
jgi:transcriptional regulator with XRE-family HTH domain